MKYDTPYVPPTLTVDAVVFQLIGSSLSVLLMQRANEPFQGTWALPGGYTAQGETTRSSLERIVHEKTGVHLETDVRYVEQLYTFDTIARDPRGHAVSVTYLACGRGIKPQGGTALLTEFFPLDQLPDLAYDHQAIISYAHERLRAKLTYTNAVYAFLPETFTLTELQQAYEAILGQQLDKRNFRKKFLSLNLIHETSEMKREGAHRPARLYAFNTTTLESLSRKFE